MKEENKIIIQIMVGVALAVIITLIITFFMVNNTNKIFEVEYIGKSTYEFKDGSWFICNDDEKEYIFQAVDLGDWDYNLDSKEDLKKIIATYFINKYNVDENTAIKNINNIINNTIFNCRTAFTV